MFQQLNEQGGITIIIVTHDALVAKHAQRIIRIHDGLIVEDAQAVAAAAVPEPTGNLDSRTSAEVLHMFQELNEQAGITIIIVTHDANVAKHAQQIIRIHDGLIVDDTHGAAAKAALGTAAPGGVP